MQLDSRLVGFKDPRVVQLLKGAGSLQLLARTLKQDDWLVVVQDTVKAMPQYQFATTVPYSSTNIDDIELQHIMQDAQLYAELSQQDKAIFDGAKQALTTCPVCKRSHYKSKLSQIASKYRHSTPKSQYAPWLQYPETRYQQLPVLDTNTKPAAVDTTRKPCYDCIQKHVGQAYITGMEARMGYPQHIMLCYGHLAEAIQQCPQDALALKALLTLCLGISRIAGQAFVPLTQIYTLVQYFRHIDQGSVAKVQNKPDTTYTLEHGIDAELVGRIQDKDKTRLLQLITLLHTYCDAVTATQSPDYDACRNKWIGVLGSIAELLAGYSLQAANAIRNIRLMFYATPQLITSVPEYALYDVKALLLQQLSSQSAETSWPASNEQGASDAAKTT